MVCTPMVCGQFQYFCGGARLRCCRRICRWGHCETRANVATVFGAYSLEGVHAELSNLYLNSETPSWVSASYWAHEEHACCVVAIHARHNPPSQVAGEVEPPLSKLRRVAHMESVRKVVCNVRATNSRLAAWIVVVEPAPVGQGRVVAISAPQCAWVRCQRVPPLT